MEKGSIRERVWDELDESGEARFPFPPHGRIPNFAGADEAADRLAETDAWAKAAVVKANPDAPQRPVRRLALEAGNVVYVAVPRLREEECFLRLDPAEIDDIAHATTIGGSAEVGEAVTPDEMEPIDLIVSGSVAVDDRGARIGKGEGYSDLEYAILGELGLVDDRTPVATTVHPIQRRDETWPVDDYDVPMDLVVTPEAVIETHGRLEKPVGLAWELLSDERVAEIPVLAALRPT